MTWRQFVKALEGQGYELRMQRKYPTLKPPGKERCVRFKTLGKQYTPEVIRMRILYPRRKVSAVENRQAGPRVRYTRLRTHGRPVRGFTGLRALYYRYLYELGALPKKPVYPGYAVRQDIRKLDQYVEQMRFLLRHGIDSREQLAEYRKPLLDEIAVLTKERHGLYRSAPDSPRIGQITARLKVLRKESRMCGRIEKRSVEIGQRLTEARAEQKKHVENEKQKGADKAEKRRDALQREDRFH